MSYAGAANAVGGLIQSVGAQQSQRAMFNTFQDEIDKQNAFRMQGTSAFNQAIPGMGYEAAQQQLAAGRDRRNVAYGNILGMNTGVGNTPYSAADMLRLNLLGQRKAATGAYSDWELNQSIDRIRLNEQLNKIANFAHGQAQVFPYEMFQAQHKGDEIEFWGKLISSLGGASPNWNPQTPPNYGQGPIQGMSGGGMSPYLGDVNINPDLAPIA